MSTHHNLLGNICGCTNSKYQNITRGAHSRFLSADIIQVVTLIWSFIATTTFYHLYISPTIDLNIKLLIPIYALFFGIIILLITALKHDSLLTLFPLRSIIRSIVLIKERGKRGRYRIQVDLIPSHKIEDLGQWKVITWKSGNLKTGNKGPHPTWTFKRKFN